MNIPKEMILNQLIRVPAVREEAKKRHSTGIGSDPAGIDKYFRIFTGHTDIRGKDILELGPGRTVGIVARAKKEGARSVTVADIETYLSDTDLADLGIGRIIYDGTDLPLDGDSFDVIWSKSVFEHLRRPRETVKETYRLLRAGGISIQIIDLVDHFSYDTADPYAVFNCLRYPSWVWNAMTWNRSNYVNRLRMSDWVRLHKDAGFKVTVADTVRSDFIEKNLAADPRLEYLRRYSAEDAVVKEVTLVCSK